MRSITKCWIIYIDKWRTSTCSRSNSAWTQFCSAQDNGDEDNVARRQTMLHIQKHSGDEDNVSTKIWIILPCWIVRVHHFTVSRFWWSLYMFKEKHCSHFIFLCFLIGFMENGFILICNKAGGMIICSYLPTIKNGLMMMVASWALSIV